MIAAAAAGADVVDVAIDSQFLAFSVGRQILNLRSPSTRHVGIDFSAVYGCCMYGFGADNTWHGDSLRRYSGP